MTQSSIQLAAHIISKSDATHPADGVLREELRKQRGLSRDDGWEISRAVFAYFRWLGWLDESRPVTENVERALDFAERFRKDPQSFDDNELVQNSVPEWAHEQLEISPALARTLQSEPSIWLRTKRGMRDEVAQRLHSCSVPDGVAMSDVLKYEGSVDLFRTKEFHEGLFELQDISSQAVSVVCGPKPGETWWDSCAGEGGKTLHFSELMQNKGLIWASDRAEWRLKKLKQRTARAKAFNYRTALWDGGVKLPTKTKFDGVLVDAPCSGVGTWQRNPHARWTTTLDDVKELAEIQTRLLAHVASALKPSGLLVYSVCTTTRLETSGVRAAFQKQFPELQPVSLVNPCKPDVKASEELWMWPQDFGGNGMFVAAWRRP